MNEINVENVLDFEEWVNLKIGKCDKEMSKLNENQGALFNYWNHYRNAFQQCLYAYQYINKINKDEK